MRSCVICTAHQQTSGDKIKKNELGGTYCECVGEERCIQGGGAGQLRERGAYRVVVGDS